MNTFSNRLDLIVRKNKSLVCVGLDPDPRLIPDNLDVNSFGKLIVDSTKDLVCAFKPNLAFYEALGIDGLRSLDQTITHIRKEAPEVIVIGDAKRGDIASTSIRHAESLFGFWGFDAVTVNAYGGGESLEPFLSYKEKGILVWCRSSNPGSSEFQNLEVSSEPVRMKLFEWIATSALGWNFNNNLGLIVGATYPDDLRLVREKCPGMPILVPGVGAQHGSVTAAVKAGRDVGYPNLMISSSRSIIYANNKLDRLPSAARSAADQLRNHINQALESEGMLW